MSSVDDWLNEKSAIADWTVCKSYEFRPKTKPTSEVTATAPPGKGMQTDAVGSTVRFARLMRAAKVTLG